jgi:ParB-like chromosome segregation protein Spo0J
MVRWSLQSKNIKDLKKHPKNPRRLTKSQFDQIKKSIDKFGLIDKPVVNTDGTIIGGHQRIEVLKKQGIKEIECWVPDDEITERDIEELNIRLNRNSADWDWDILANEFEVPDLLQWGFTTTDMEIVQKIEEKEDPDKKEKKKKECPNCGHQL